MLKYPDQHLRKKRKRIKTGTSPVPQAAASRKEKTHKHKQIRGIVPGLGGCQNFVYVFFRVIPYGGEKTHKQNPPQNPGTIP